MQPSIAAIADRTVYGVKELGAHERDLFPAISACCQNYGIKKNVIVVSADVILTHPVGVNLTHLGNDGGFLATDNVDSGASSGDQSNGASRRQH